MPRRFLLLPGLACIGAVAGHLAGRITWSPLPAAVEASGLRPASPALQETAAGEKTAPVLPPFDALNPRNFYEALAANPGLIAAHPVSAFPAEAQRSLSFYGLLVVWIQREPEHAVTWITQQPAIWISAFLEEFGDTIAQNSIDAAIDLTRRLNAPGKFPVFENLLVAALPRHPQKLQEVLDSTLLPEETRTALRLAWAKLDGATAITSAKNAGIPEYDYGEILKAAARTAPGLVLSEAEQLAGSDEGAARSAILDILAAKDPETVFRYSQKYPDDPALQKPALAAWQTIIMNGDPAGIALVESGSAHLPGGAAIMAAFAETDPVKAAAKLNTAWNPASSEAVLETGTTVAGSIANLYAAADPAGALTWALSLPEVEWRRRAVQQAANTVSNSDPFILSEWLHTAPPSEDLDNVITGLVHQIPDDPQSAWQWAERISSPALREETKGWLLANWRLLDPDSAPGLPPAGP